MKKTILTISILFIAVLLIIYFKYVFGWLEFRWNRDTPDRFLNQVVAEKLKYVKDSAEILNQFRSEINKHTYFFSSKEYDDSTQIIIDSILYSPDFRKIAVFVLTKNPTSKQLAQINYSKWYYDATCYLGYRQKDTLSLFWIGPSYINSKDRVELKKTIRKYYFRIITTERKTKPKFNFNLNDIRFWNDSIWGNLVIKK